MPAPYPRELKEAAVAALERGDGTVKEVAETFGIGERTLLTWCRQLRERGTLELAARGGGNFSRVDVQRLLRVVADRPDSTSDELTRAYNSGLSKRLKVHRSSILRALRREGFVFKKNVPGPQSKTAQTSRRREKNSDDG